MDTEKEIRDCVDWLKDYYYKGHQIVTEKVFTSEPLSNISKDVLLQLGFRYVKNPATSYFEYPDKTLTPERVDAVVMLCRSDVDGENN